MSLLESEDERDIGLKFHTFEFKHCDDCCARNAKDKAGESVQG